MAVYRYTIPDIPPSNNQYIGRTNFREYQNIKKKWAGLVAVYCRPKPPEPLHRAVVTLFYHFKDKRRRDLDNYSGKFILDGLTKAGIIEDDCFFVIDLQLKAVCDKRGEVEIFVEEILQQCSTKQL